MVSEVQPIFWHQREGVCVRASWQTGRIKRERKKEERESTGRGQGKTLSTDTPQVIYLLLSHLPVMPSCYQPIRKIIHSLSQSPRDLSLETLSQTHPEVCLLNS
jgi:hypothetical protein